MSKKLTRVEESNLVTTSEGFFVASLVPQQRVQHDMENLPEIFRDAEKIDGSFYPTPIWHTPGQFGYGVYLGKQDNVGEYGSSIYHFETPVRAGQPFRWSVWGTTQFNTVMSRVALGDLVLLYYTGLMDGGKKPMHSFKAAVKRVGMYTHADLEALAMKL